MSNLITTSHILWLFTVILDTGGDIGGWLQFVLIEEGAYTMSNLITTLLLSFAVDNKYTQSTVDGL